MRHKLFNEDGDYRDIATHEGKNLLECETAYTPEGINVGWDYFETIEEAMAYYNIELKPIEEEINDKDIINGNG